MATESLEVRRARRSWPAEYKLAILREIDEAKVSGDPGAVGEICRREGLYSSLISEWRNQRDRGALEAMSDRKPGRRPKDRTAEKLAAAEARVAELEARLATAEELIEAQGKVSALLQAMSAKSAELNMKLR
jgi:transposase-like protein